ncbi:MAG: outer membrane beta-barrel protein, partial [Planctomycetaceae bacterium]|nr:outer membrane beta-barrel protein [Planctomycetaceae bacterium]
MLRKSWSSLIAGILMLGSVSGADAAAADRAASGIEGYEVIFAEASPRFTHQFGLVRCSGTDCCSDPCGDILAGGCGEDCCGEGCGCGEDDDKCFQIGGWTQFGYQDGPDGAFTGNGAFNNVNFGAGFPNSSEWNTFGLYQQGLYINRTADGSNGLDYGFRAEVIYGIDGNEAQSFGNNPGRYDFANGYDHGIYEWALPQLYAEVAAGDLSVKVGHFYTIVGYEVIPSYGNFFLSRQLTFYNSEPFTHTGALATYQVSDSLSVMGGWTLGWDTGFDRFNNGSNFIGG